MVKIIIRKDSGMRQVEVIGADGRRLDSAHAKNRRKLQWLVSYFTRKYVN
jgi:hypothetical protein